MIKLLLIWSWRLVAWIFIFLSLLLTMLPPLFYAPGSNTQHVVTMLYVSCLLCTAFTCLDIAIVRLLGGDV